MKKRSFILIAVLLMAVFSAFCLVACDDEGGTEDPSHSHTFTAGHDDTHHYQICECGEKKDVVEHSYTYTFDKEKHYAACECGYSLEGAEHDMQDGICSVCGYDKEMIMTADELKAKIDELTNPENPNYVAGDKDVVLKLAPNTTFSGPFTIKQYPQWNGNDASNLSYAQKDEYDQVKLRLVGGEGTVIKGSMYIKGPGNGNSAQLWLTDKVATVFENIELAGMIDIRSAAVNVEFVDCKINTSSSHTFGKSGNARTVNITFKECEFINTGRINAYYYELNFIDCTGAFAKGFVNIQSGSTTNITNCNFEMKPYQPNDDNYIVRTNASAIINITNSTLNAESAGPLFLFRGNNNKVTIKGGKVRADIMYWMGVDNAQSYTGNSILVDNVEQIVPAEQA